MSRIGRMPVPLASGIELKVDGAVVRVSAPILGDEQETVHRLNDFVGQIFEVLGTFIPN